MTPAQRRLAPAAWGQPGTPVGDLYQQLGITRQPWYRPVALHGTLRLNGQCLLERRR